MFNPDMLVLARESREYSQTKLADEVGVSQALISQIENGLKEPSQEIAEKMGAVLEYPPSLFFLTDTVYGLPTTFHRKQKRTRVRVVNRIGAEIRLRTIHLRRLLRSVEFEPEIELPQLDDEYGPPEKIANLVRATLLVKEGPIRNLVSVLERAGIVIFDLPSAGPTVDAVGVRVPDLPPMIFVSPDVPTDRMRYTLAHELGHLVMHSIPTEKMEDEANRFAGEFLLPERSIKRELQKLNMRKLAELKLKWRVSMAALLYRASRLGTISEAQQSYYWAQFSKKGYRKQEPPDLAPPQEEPTLLRTILRVHTEQLGYGVEELSASLHTRADELVEIYPIQGRTLQVVR